MQENSSTTLPFQRGERLERSERERPLRRTIQAQVVEDDETGAPLSELRSGFAPLRIFLYGVSRSRLLQAAKRLGLPVMVARDLEEADVLVTLRTYYRSRQQPVVDAEMRGLQVYVLRANTINQMEQSLAELFNIQVEVEPYNMDAVSNQTRAAIDNVLNGQRWVELPPASSAIRRMQHEMARQAQLVSHSYGKEPNRRVRIFRD